jgi:hypothetical protein
MATVRQEIPERYGHLRTLGRGAFGYDPIFWNIIVIAHIFSLVFLGEVVPTAPRPNHIFFTRLESNRVAIKRITTETAFKDSYHAKQVYREISMLKQVGRCDSCFHN